MAYSWGSLSRKRSLAVAEIWPSKRQSSIWVHEKRKEIHYNPVASCLSKLHSDPTFSITLFSPLGPQTGSGAVPRSPETLRHSPPFRGRPRDALFCIFLSPGPFLFFKVLAILLGFWKLRNFLRPINASMKEAKAKRHLPFWIERSLVLSR